MGRHYNANDFIMMTYGEVRELEQLRKENRELKQCIKRLEKAAKKVHDAVVELDGEACL